MAQTNNSLRINSDQETFSRLSKKKIAVDLTPMLPNGDNGGAKLMTIELLHALAGLLPETTFVLLTSESSHAELGPLENKYINIQRICVLHTGFHLNSSIIAHTSNLSSVQDFIDLLKAYARQVLPSKLKQCTKRWRWLAKHAATRSSVFLRQMQIDLLFCPFSAPFYADPFTPTISVIYDLQFRAYPQFFALDDRIQREENFKNACQKADYLITISEFVRTTVIETTDFPPESIIAIPIGLLRAPEQLNDETAGNRLLEKYNLRHGEYMFYPANFWQHKNHAMLLTAFNTYRRTQIDTSLKLVCTGAPGPEAEAFCESVRRMGLADWVIYAGYVGTEAYDGLLRAAFAMIFPSLYEGFGIPVLEAMAAGVPVLCSNVTSLPEVGGEAVLYFDPRQPDQIANSITRLTKEPHLRENQIAGGLQRCTEFGGVIRMAHQYASVFNHALNPISRKHKNTL